MKRRLAKIAAAMVVAALMAGNMASTALAYNTNGVNVAAQSVWCNPDGSCDVNGVCVNGGVCDGSHGWNVYAYDGSSYHHEESYDDNSGYHHEEYYDDSNYHHEEEYHDYDSYYHEEEYHHDSGSGHHGGGHHSGRHH